MTRFPLSLGLLILPFTACIPPTHHLYSGETLKVGQQNHTWAISYPENYYELNPAVVISTNQLPDGPYAADNFYSNTDSSCQNCTMSWVSIPSISRSWRMGAMDSVGIFPGLEFGYTLQSPLSFDFGLKLGLPSPLKSMHHSFAAGWAVGFWIDNSWWAEHTMDYRLDENLKFIVQNRMTLMATQFSDADPNADFLDHTFKSWKIQSGIGLSYRWDPTPDHWQPGQMELQAYNQWFPLPLALGSQDHSYAFYGRSTPLKFKPTIAVGFTWF